MYVWLCVCVCVCVCVWQGINKNLSFSAEDREENIRRIGEIAKLFVDSGTLVLCSFISPYEADRNRVRALHEESGMSFIEVYVDCPLSEAEARYECMCVCVCG